MRARHCIAALLVAGVTAATPGVAATGPTDGGVWNFRVMLDGEPVGWHRYVVRRDGAETEVESRASFDVRFLFINAYRYRHEARERWRGTCLDTLESRTETNGDVEEVEAASLGDARLVAGPGCVMSFAYWDPRILGASRLLNSQTGEWLPVRVADRGTEVVDLSGRPVRATRHRLSAPGLQIDLWYSDGRWVALEAPTPGGRILRYELE